MVFTCMNCAVAVVVIMSYYSVAWDVIQCFRLYFSLSIFNFTYSIMVTLQIKRPQHMMIFDVGSEQENHLVSGCQASPKWHFWVARTHSQIELTLFTLTIGNWNSSRLIVPLKYDNHLTDPSPNPCQYNIYTLYICGISTRNAFPQIPSIIIKSIHIKPNPIKIIERSNLLAHRSIRAEQNNKMARHVIDRFIILNHFLLFLFFCSVDWWMAVKHQHVERERNVWPMIPIDLSMAPSNVDFPRVHLTAYKIVVWLNNKEMDSATCVAYMCVCVTGLVSETMDQVEIDYLTWQSILFIRLLLNQIPAIRWLVPCLFHWLLGQGIGYILFGPLFFIVIFTGSGNWSRK